MSILVFIDCETTGLDPNIHSIIQLSGSVVVKTDSGYEEKETFDYKMRPFADTELDIDALRVNNITIDEMLSYEYPYEVYKKFERMLQKHWNSYNDRGTGMLHFVGYNARFDFDFIREWFKRCGNNYMKSYFYFPPIDVMNLAAVKLMNERQELPNFKLETVAKYLVIEPEGKLHDSAVDIELTKRMFFKLMEM